MAYEFAALREEARAYLNPLYDTALLAASWKSQRPGARRLDYAERWAVTVEVEDGENIRSLTLEIRIPHDFPLRAPAVYLSDSDLAQFFPLPHVDHRGFVCTFDPAEVTPNIDAPGAIVLATIEKAVRILEDGLAQRNAADFDEEVLAYWSQAYAGCGEADMGCLSLIEGDLGSSAYLLTLSKPIGPFSQVIHDGGDLAEQFKASLGSRAKMQEREAFVLGTLALGPPPYALRNRAAVALVEKAGQRDAFRRYLSQTGEAATVLFQTAHGGHILGWQHPPPPEPKRKARKGYRADTLSRIQALTGPDRMKPVQRIAPQVLTPERLHRRTAGISAPTEAKPCVFIAGLGSIGARLADGLTDSVSGFGLLDPDVLTVENIRRHLLGLDAVGQNKAEALASRFLAADPFLTLKTFANTSLGHALADTPRLLDDYDVAILALGDLATELWFDAEVTAGRIGLPALYVWVEPHLAGGHCVFIRPGQGRLAAQFDGGAYAYTVIAASEYDARRFTQREAGCQTTYVPYAGAHVRRFLAAIFPHVLNAIQSTTPEESGSFRLRWTGDLEWLRRQGISLASDVDPEASFRLDIVPLS